MPSLVRNKKISLYWQYFIRRENFAECEICGRLIKVLKGVSGLKAHLKLHSEAVFIDRAKKNTNNNIWNYYDTTDDPKKQKCLVSNTSKYLVFLALQVYTYLECIKILTT